MHGMARNLPFKVKRIGSDKDGVFIVCSLDTKDHPDIRKYEKPAVTTLVYRLNGSELRLEGRFRRQKVACRIALWPAWVGAAMPWGSLPHS